MPKSNLIELIEVRPGIFVEKCLATPAVNSRTAAHYAQLVGHTIKEIRFERTLDGEPLPIFILDDGSSAAVLRDPEGNGPGHLDIQPHA